MFSFGLIGRIEVSGLSKTTSETKFSLSLVDDHQGQKVAELPGLLRGLGGVLDVHVYGFVAGDGGDVGVNFPVEGGWEQLSGLR
jgi:hypothetical protein